jgi:hypothetical protein
MAFDRAIAGATPADFLYTDVLGAGNFGVVLSAQWARPEVAPSPTTFAVKALFRIDRLDGGNESLKLQEALRKEEQHCRRVHDARPGLRHVVPKVWAAFPSSPVPQQLLACVARAPADKRVDLRVCFPDGCVHIGTLCAA